MKEKIKIVIAEDHTIVRAGIKTLLESLYNVEVVGEAADGRKAIEVIKKCKPDLVLMDINMPELNGLDAAAILVKEQPDVKIVILSMYANEEYVKQALRAGAVGYLLKDSALTEIEIVIDAVLKGDIYLSPAVSRRVVDELLIMDSKNKSKKNENLFLDLTQRQREILQLIVEGYSTKEIAYKLNVSAKTVEAHRANIMDRIGVHDIPGLVKYAIRNKLISENGI